MQGDNFYKEKISSKWWMTGILTAFTAGFLFVLVYQVLVGPIGTRPAPNWFFLFMFLLFLGVTINFSRLSIRITHLSVKVSYGIFRYIIPWENIKNCYLDEASTINYGGWGIRIGKVQGRWRLVYNVIGAPRVVLSLKKGKFKEFVFSTEKPEEVMNIIRERRGSDS